MAEEVGDADGVHCEGGAGGDRRVSAHENDFGHLLPRLGLPALLQQIMVHHVIGELEHAYVARLEGRVVVDVGSGGP